LHKHKALLAAGGIGAGLALGLLPGAAAAGPCEQQISELGRTLSDEPTLGPVTSGALAGAAPGAIERDAPMPDPAAASVDSAPSLSEGGETSGSAGTSEMNAASAQVATSAQDVQLQQQGKPIMAQGGELQGDKEQLGFRIWADPGIKLTHTGLHRFEGDPSETAFPRLVDLAPGAGA
jgi:hypothetical protein